MVKVVEKMTELEMLEQICDRLTGIEECIAVMLVFTGIIITYLIWRK